VILAINLSETTRLLAKPHFVQSTITAFKIIVHFQFSLPPLPNYIIQTLPKKGNNLLTMALGATSSHTCRIVDAIYIDFSGLGLFFYDQTRSLLLFWTYPAS